MKKFTAISAASLLLVACGESRPTYLLSGTVDTLYNGATVSLLYGEKSDSTVVSQGAFSFEGEIDSPFWRVSSSRRATTARAAWSYSRPDRPS